MNLPVNLSETILFSCPTNCYNRLLQSVYIDSNFRQFQNSHIRDFCQIQFKNELLVGFFLKNCWRNRNPWKRQIFYFKKMERENDILNNAINKEGFVIIDVRCRGKIFVFNRHSSKNYLGTFRYFFFSLNV